MESEELIVKAFRKYSISRSYRKSNMREIVLLHLWHSSDSKDADTLFTEINAHKNNIRIGSIYNALRWLTKEGFLLRTSPDKRALYCISKQQIMDIIQNQNLL